jgi:hypothetical protein
MRKVPARSILHVPIRQLAFVGARQDSPFPEMRLTECEAVLSAWRYP